MSTFELTEAQREFFGTFGFLNLPGLFAEEFTRIEDAFEELMRSRGGDRHDGRERFGVAPFLNHSEYLCSLLDDERLHGIARALCGDDYQYWNSDGKYYVGDTRWHSDGSLSNPVGFVKLALYLDPVDAESGALRVIPGSHRTGEPYAEMIDEQIRGERFWGGLPGDRIPAVALTSRPGDLVLFNQALKHGAWGGGTRRRMFTINYTRAITPALLERYREVIASHGYSKADVFGAPPGPLLRGAPPRRLDHLRALQEHIPDAA
jgi:hypothetical protein